MALHLRTLETFGRFHNFWAFRFSSQKNAVSELLKRKQENSHSVFVWPPFFSELL